MRAAGFLAFGPPEVLRIVERPDPVPSAGEVVVRVAAATVNPTDMLMRTGAQVALMAGIAPPYVPGMEFAGHVQAIGGGVQALAPGDRVMGIVNPRRPLGGAYAEYVCVPAASVVTVPMQIDLAAAATVPMNGLTAFLAIETLALPPGRAVLITGGAGALGGYCIQLARLAGLRVIADAHDSDVALLKTLGADLILPRGAGLAQAFRKRLPDGADGLIDCALLGAPAATLVRDGGVAVSVRRSHPFDDPRLRTIYVAVTDALTRTAALEQLRDAVVQGALTPRVGQRLPLEQAAQAHQLLERGGLRGRIVLAATECHRAQ